MSRLRKAVSRLDREQCVSLLEAVSIQCYDHETVQELREAVLVNVQDGTIDRSDVPGLEDDDEDEEPLPEGMIDHDAEDRRAYNEERNERPLY